MICIPTLSPYLRHASQPRYQLLLASSERRVDVEAAGCDGGKEEGREGMVMLDEDARDLVDGRGLQPAKTAVL